MSNEVPLELFVDIGKSTFHTRNGRLAGGMLRITSNEQKLLKIQLTEGIPNFDPEGVLTNPCTRFSGTDAQISAVADDNRTWEYPALLRNAIQVGTGISTLELELKNGVEPRPIGAIRIDSIGEIRYHGYQKTSFGYAFVLANAHFDPEPFTSEKTVPAGADTFLIEMPIIASVNNNSDARDNGSFHFLLDAGNPVYRSIFSSGGDSGVRVIPLEITIASNGYAAFRATADLECSGTLSPGGVACWTRTEHARCVLSVNGIKADASGNVEISTSDQTIYPVGDCTAIRCITQGTTVRIKWRDPDDLVADGVVLARWAKTVLVRKMGDYPDSPDDGVVVIATTERNQFRTTAFIDALPDLDNDYYYTLFPISASALVNTNAANRFAANVLTWTTVADIVRSGDAQQYFAVGDILTAEHRTYGTIYWEIAGFDQHAPESMTLLSKYTLAALQFDAPEKSYALTRDTVFQSSYLLNLSGNSALNGDYFLENETATGSARAWARRTGTLRLLWLSESGKWAIVSTATSGVVATQATAAADPWNGVWSNGAIVDKAKKYYTFDGANYNQAAVTDDADVAANTYYELIHDNGKVLNGYGSWKQSAIRQWLNSSALSGAWWTPQNIWDAPPLYAGTTPGFLAGFAGSDFCNALGEIDLVTAKNTVSDGGGSGVSTDRIFLPSLTELYGVTNNTIGEGSMMSVYSGAGNADRVKCNNSGVAQSWWLRSPVFAYSSMALAVGPAGTTSNVSVQGVLGIAPACVIC